MICMRILLIFAAQMCKTNRPGYLLFNGEPVRDAGPLSQANRADQRSLYISYARLSELLEFTSVSSPGFHWFADQSRNTSGENFRAQGKNSFRRIAFS